MAFKLGQKPSNPVQKAQSNLPGGIMNRNSPEYLAASNPGASSVIGTNPREQALKNNVNTWKSNQAKEKARYNALTDDQKNKEQAKKLAAAREEIASQQIVDHDLYKKNFHAGYGGVTTGAANIASTLGEEGEVAGGFMPGVGEVIDAKNTIKDLSKGDYSGAAMNAAGFLLPFVPGKAIKKLFGRTDSPLPAPKPMPTSNPIIDARDISDYNYAVDMGVPGIKDVSPNEMDDLLKSKFNTKPMYRAVDVNTPLSVESKNIMRSEGLDPDNLEHVAEYMGTHIPLQNITNKGRRTGHDKILEGSGKDIMYTSNDPEWIVDRYGGENPYVVKTYEDQLPKNRIDQINKLSPKHKEPDWRVIDRKNLDLNKIPSGASIDKNALSVPGATGDIKLILGKYGEKVRDGASVISGKDLATLRAKGVRF